MIKITPGSFVSKLICFSLICIAGPSNAQENRAFNKGQSVVSAGIGIGNVWRNFLKDSYNYPDGTYTVSSIGPFAVSYEYGLFSRISAGVHLGYSVVNGDFNGFGEKFTEKLTNFSALVRANYHVGKFKKFDPYLGGGVGYYHFRYHNTQPGIINSRTPGSFGYSAQIGLTYYFVPKAAAYLELGYVAGSIAQIGFLYKLQ